MSWFIKPGMPFKQVSGLLNRHYKEIESGKVKGFYLVCGEEKFLVHRVARRLALAFTSCESLDDENVRILEGEDATVGAVLRELLTNSFKTTFCGRHAIIVINPPFVEVAASDSHGRAKKVRAQQPNGLSRLIVALKHSIPSHSILIVAIDAPLSEEHPLVQFAFDFGAAIFLGKLKRAELPYFVESISKRLGIQIDKDGVDELLIRVGDDLWQISSEIEKLACYVGERLRVTVEDVREIVPSIAGDIFKLIGLLANGDVNGARSMMSLLVSREPLAKIIQTLARQYRLLLQARWLIDSGAITRAQLELWSQNLQEHLRTKLAEAIRSRLPEGEKMNLLLQHPYAIKVVLEQAHSLTEDSIVSAVMELQRADVILKTGGMREDEVADWLVIRLCQLSRLRKFPST